MRVPIRPLAGRWPRFLQKSFTRYFWKDPRVILDEAVTPEQFRTAMSAVHVGNTIKITAGNRHPASDEILLRNVDLEDATIVDIGASDGSTSVDLIGKLPTFGGYVIADLYFHLTVAQARRHSVFFDNEGECILVVGPRALAWPAKSAFVRAIYGRAIRAAKAPSAPRREVLLLNPSARDLIASDPRVSYRVHDVFQPWTGPTPTVIKVANLLRRLYFSDVMILGALKTLLAGLPEGAFLLIVDNPRIKGLSERAGLYRRMGGRFDAVEETTDPPEVRDLIDKVSLE